MDGVDLIHTHEWHPLTRFNLNHPFFGINAHTMIYTWIALGALIIIAALMPLILSRKGSHIRYLFMSGMQTFLDLTTQTFGRFAYSQTVFIFSLFLFILAGNLVAIFPFVEEATKDINTTFAMGILSFLYVQYNAIATHGIMGYIQEFTSPIFLMAPLHVISKLSTIISMSFRLFGNIFGSGIILHIYLLVLERSVVLQLLGLGLGLNVLMTAFFILFEGCLQAFVFTMLAMTYLGIAMTPEHTEQSHA